MALSKTRNKSAFGRKQFYEKLEPRCLLAAVPIITEFMAANESTISDGQANYSDWIELHNAGDQPVNLLGYSLTDDAFEPSKFVLPTKTLFPGDHLVIFTSGENAIDSSGNIHTNFKLSASGEFVGFFDPTGNLISEFGNNSEDYPTQLTDVSFGLDISGGNYILNSQRYFVLPTPGTTNTPNSADLAPIISEQKLIGTAISSQNIFVTSSPILLSGSIANVTMFVRVNYGSETQITIFDNGIANDVIAGDGIYTASIPSSLFTEGDMVRWRFVATASNGLVGKGPQFLDPGKSPQYFGTIVADSSIDTQLPVIYWFTNNPNGATGSGARGSVFYNGEFYDNILMRRRGQSSNNSPKKNLKFDFNPGDRFLLKPGMLRVDEINLSNTYYDQADVRATLASEVFTSAGQAAPLSFPIQTRLNGEFWSLSIYIEQVDADFLERNGLDPNGALYKVDGGSVGNNGFNPVHGLTGYLKRTRLNEGNAALQELADAVDENLPQAQRAQYLYDHVDVFSVINYLAATSLIHNADHLGKNHYIYQDTEGTGKWSFIPWDLDLTFGKNGANTPNTEVYQAASTNQSSNDYPNAHPFFGDSDHTRFNNPVLWNRLIDAVLDTPEFKEMYLRRLRTVMDEVLQSPTTPVNELKLEARLAELLPLIQDDWTLDDARWIEAPQTDLNRGTDWGENLPLATHFQRIIDRYLEPRRDYLFNYHNIDNANPGVAVELVTTSDPAKFIVPTSNISNWTSTSFNDTSWGSGDKGFGYDTNPGYDPLINTELQIQGSQRHVYTRSSFTIGSAAELSQITQLLLDVNYDDGFIAYLNGVEIARSAGSNGSGLTATVINHEAAGFETFALNTAAINALNVGSNVLAMQGINITTNSSDMLLDFSLTGFNGNPDAVGIPNEQIGSPTILFNGFDANPASGNQGQEYIRLHNPNSTAVDISGWKLAGGVDLAFRPGTVIPAGGELYAVADIQQFLATSQGEIGGGQENLTHGNYSGQLGFLSETVNLISVDGNVVATLQIPATAANDLQSFLRITEVNYNPASVSGSEEFIEFTNISTGGSATTLDLGGVSITDGPSIPFVFPAGTALASGARLIVVKDIGAFVTEYASVASSQILGPYSGSLSNSGERIRVEDAGGNTLLDLHYGDANPWAFAADGVGATLELADENTLYEQLDKYYSWQASAIAGGTPGTGAVAHSGVVINELLANTDVPQVDSVELFNNNSNSVNIGGWYLSNSATNLLRYQIPTGTTIPSNGYLVLRETDFGFSLSALGQKLYLTQASGGETSRFENAVEILATFNGESIGRLPNGSGPLTRLASNSFGSENGTVKVGPLVISEVNYNPGPPTAAALALFVGLTENDLEFIEISNPTSSSIDTTNWRIRGESDFDFPSLSISSGQAVVVVSFDPSDTANADLVAAFQAHYGISSANLVGPFSGTLSNSTGRISLQQPDTPVLTVIPRVVVDEVVYDDLAPWGNADGSGQSLHRNGINTSGNLALSWTADAPNPGVFEQPFLLGDANQDGVVNFLDISPFISLLTTQTFLAEADANQDGVIDFFDISDFIDLLTNGGTS